ncbi:hypothetical protein BDZ45DRAFT_688555 [Acephala macrosclerotiorum]|nr:hypothetical protein BDZ45DRAFT_688555 [Acephala macrosclerotiorum]
MTDKRNVEASDYSDKDELLPSKKHNSLDTMFRKQNEEGLKSPRKSRSTIKSCLGFFGIFIFVTTSVLGFLTIQNRAYSKSQAPATRHSTPSEHAMTRPSHTLMPHRRHALTIAINRLMNTPSRLGLNTSLYGDFTYIHIRLKNSIHHSTIPPFLFHGTDSSSTFSRTL